MVAKNDVTGDNIASKKTTEVYRKNWDRIFKKKKTPNTNKKTGK